jgi:hypothetical protein
MEQALNDAISQVVSKHPEEIGNPEMAVKWVALIETMDANGKRGLWTATSDGVTAWDTKGILAHATDLQTSQTMLSELGLLEDDDDGEPG